jgi:UMF1 family MFS transporter
VPITGFLLDKYARRITGLRYTSIATAILYTACALSTISNYEILALVFFIMGTYVYLLTFTFYTPLINDIAPVEKRGRISGWGIAANYLGQFTGLLFVLPFSSGAWSIFHASPRAETLLPAVILFTILMLPMLLFFKEPLRPTHSYHIRNDLKELFAKSKEVFLYPGVALFILAYFLFNDAILTSSNNFSIFLQQVWGVSDTIKTYILMGIVITSAIGGLVSGPLADKFGHKRTLVWVLTGWVFILPLVAFLTNFTVFIIVTVIMGLWFGANWTVSRSVMSYLAPPHAHNLTFAYFGLVERASSFVGPIVWSIVLFSTAHAGSDKYRYATLAVSLFIIIGLFVLRKVKSDRNN